MDVFLDLDGTLTDNREGILRSIRHALKTLDEPVPDEASLLSWIGPPLQVSFMNHLGDKERADTAVELYRARYQEIGLFENAVYEGVPEMMQELRKAGCRLWLATSKPHVYANRIASYFGLSPHLDGVFGSELDGTRGDKTDLLLHARKTIGAADPTMLGDRRFDMIGACNTGTRAIGALWGYGSREELCAAGAEFLADRPSDVPSLLGEMI